MGGGGSAPNCDDPILLAHVATSELSGAHVLYALLCFRPTCKIRKDYSLWWRGGGLKPLVGVGLELSQPPSRWLRACV